MKAADLKSIDGSSLLLNKTALGQTEIGLLQLLPKAYNFSGDLTDAICEGKMPIYAILLKCRLVLPSAINRGEETKLNGKTPDALL